MRGLLWWFKRRWNTNNTRSACQRKIHIVGRIKAFLDIDLIVRNQIDWLAVIRQREIIDIWTTEKHSYKPFSWNRLINKHAGNTSRYQKYHHLSIRPSRVAELYWRGGTTLSHLNLLVNLGRQLYRVGVVMVRLERLWARCWGNKESKLLKQV